MRGLNSMQVPNRSQKVRDCGLGNLFAAYSLAALNTRGAVN